MSSKMFSESFISTVIRAESGSWMGWDDDLYDRVFSDEKEGFIWVSECFV